MDLEKISPDPLSDWGWGEDECKVVLKLNGLSFPENQIQETAQSKLDEAFELADKSTLPGSR